MRKTILCVMAAMIILCMQAGCSGARRTLPGREETVVLPATLQAELSVKMGALTLAGDLTRTITGDISLTVRSPENLRGMVFSRAQGELAVHYGSLSFTVDDVVQPQSALLRVLGDCLTAVEGATFTTKKAGADIVLELRGIQGPCEVTLDSKNFLPQRIFIPNLDFEASLNTENA